MAIFTYEDYSKLARDVKRANQRIQKLQKRYGEGSWAISELYNKIDNNNVKGISTLTGNIRINRNMSEIQLKAISKATSEFLSSKTSTLTGARQTTNQVKKSLQATFGDEVNNITNKEIDTLYNIVENKDTRDLAEKIGASEVWAKTIQAKEQNLTFNKYVELFKDDININDKDVQEFLKEIYTKYKQS